MGEKTEEICGQHFLNWYNEQYKRNYVLKRAETYFPDIKGGPRWEFVAYEPDNPEKWIGIEIKELNPIREVSIWFEFWKDLCLELTQDLVARGIQGKFDIIHPPVVYLKPRERPKLLKALLKVLIDKESILKVDFTDIGPDIADKFTSWPREKSDLNEYDRWGENRPSKLLINKISDSGCEVTSPISPIRALDAVKLHEEAFNEVFKLKNGGIQPNRQLKLAKEKGARNTILLLACKSPTHEDLIKNRLQDLDPLFISDIDYIYLVDMGSEERVIKIYPLDKG